MGVQPHILYIENNEFNQRLIKKILEPAGFPISEARDGIQGIKKAIDLKPDLVLMDLDLPYLDGTGVAAKIKSVAGLENVPIVALTARTGRDTRQRALVSGCDGCIEKPINAETFPDQIRTYLEGKREEYDPANKTQILKDINVNLIDLLRSKVEELEKANLELVKSKEELESAYVQSQQSNVELQKLNRLKENIVAITSHELRTPLSIANGYIDLLLEGMFGDVNEDQYRVLQISRQSLGDMGSLIDKITDLTRLALKKIPMELEEMDLNAAFRRVYDDLVFFMKIRNQEFIDKLCEEKLVVLADRNLMHQVFNNLLKNAVCFTPDHGKLEAKSWRRGMKAYFHIKDYGIGLKEDDLERIFEEFYQVQDITYHKSGHFEFLTRGIGVGLALCKKIVKELGGKIQAVSPGLEKGSTFTFYLPLVK